MPAALVYIGDLVAQNWALTSILVTLGLLTLIPALVVRKYVRITVNLVSEAEPSRTHFQTGIYPIPGEDVNFQAADGLRLTGTIIRPPPGITSRGLVIFAPEFKGTRRSFSRYARALIEAGYDLFTIDFRGHGDSAAEEAYRPRQWASDREVSDMLGAIAYARDWLAEAGRPDKLALFGISRGAGCCLLAAASSAAVRAVISDSGFSSDSTLEHFSKRWAKIFARVRVVYENHPPEFWRFLRWRAFRTFKRKYNCSFPSARKALLRTAPRAMLFIHGRRDSYIPLEQSRLLYALAPQPKFLWIVPDAKHNQAVDLDPEGYARRTVDFLDLYLAERPAAGNIYTQDQFAAALANGEGRMAHGEGGAAEGRKMKGKKRPAKPPPRPLMVKG